MATPEMISTVSPSSLSSIPQPCTNPSVPGSPRAQDASAIAAYEHYLRLPELFKLCRCSKDFPDWKNESVLKPSLQGLEITFRLLSIVLSDPRPYSNRREWERRLESLTDRQIEIVANLCDDDRSAVPLAGLSAPDELIARERSSQEVWKLNGTTTTVVSHTSESSLLPRLAAWDKSRDVAAKILFQIEGHMHRCPFTLGLGEPNLAGKRSLEYDLIVKPSELHFLKKSPLGIKNQENQTLYTIHQILETWLCTARRLLGRIRDRIDGGEFEEAANDCWLLERIWRLLSEIEDLHLLMDPDDFLQLKCQLAIRANSGSEAFCFRSRAFLEVINMSKDLKHMVPRILGVEVDPSGGPRVQEAAMSLLHSRRRGEGGNAGRIHLLQAFQAVEAAVKKFFFGYRQLIMVVMGSLEANGNRGLGFSTETSDGLTQMFMDPPYFPSLDAAKTFLGELISRSCNGAGHQQMCGTKLG